MNGRRLIFPIFALLMAAGCQAGAPPAGPPPRPLHVHLPGVGGIMRIDRLMLAGLKDGGVEAELIVDDWTEGNRGMGALVNSERHEAESQKLAGLLARRLRAQPNLPILLTSHSGGGAIAVWTLENLPDDVKVETVILLHPAISPDYDLSKALRHVRGRMYVFHSVHDWAVLGQGTRLFGTMDGVKTDAAGMVGFRRPAGADADLYARKLVQFPYDPAWTRYGNSGTHIGPMQRAFSAAIVAPLLGGHGVSQNGETP